MKATFWGVRGSFATARAAMLGVGGNTPCVAIELPDVHLVLDAGTGICALGERLATADHKPIHILLTHFHLDHIQGLLFFRPLFQPGREVVIWAPHARRHSPRSRLAHYFSPPFSPVELAAAARVGALPRVSGGRVADRRRGDPGRAGPAPWAHAGVPRRVRRRHARVPARSRARAQQPPRPVAAPLALGRRARQGRRPPHP